MHANLRHVGWKVTNLDLAIAEYRRLGFEPLEVETIRLCKLTNKHGLTIELIEGAYDPHLAVNWYRDESGNLFEIVEEK